MKKKLEIELFEEHTNVNIYTVRYQNDLSEFDKFLNKYPLGCEFDEDIDIIVTWITKIGEKGALERYLRPEGKFKDNVYAIPIETTNLRLYVIRISDHIIILGNGGNKKTKTYNEDPELNSYVEQLQSIDVLLRSRLIKGAIQIFEKQLFGKLEFEI
ncbi:MAG: hypothetical protein IPJ16_02375 [Bacteroidales bacterium]|nr:hypothetical protein [Bacteroidales bacterium]